MTALLTVEEYALLPDNGRPTELVRGVLVPLNFHFPRHGEICGQICFLLCIHLQQNPLGRIVCNNSGVTTERGPDTLRGPDIAFYSFERVPRGPLPLGYLDVMPELVIEVCSTPDRWSQILIKVGEYLEAGVKVVCVLDDRTETAHIYQGDEAVQVVPADQELTFPGLLDGFRAQVSTFFE